MIKYCDHFFISWFLGAPTPNYVTVIHSSSGQTNFWCLFTYHKNSKNWDTLNYYRDCPTNVIVGFYNAILRSKDADRITDRVDTDQTAP